MHSKDISPSLTLEVYPDDAGDSSAAAPSSEPDCRAPPPPPLDQETTRAKPAVVARKLTNPYIEFDPRHSSSEAHSPKVKAVQEKIVFIIHWKPSLAYILLQDTRVKLCFKYGVWLILNFLNTKKNVFEEIFSLCPYLFIFCKSFQTEIELRNKFFMAKPLFEQIKAIDLYFIKIYT